MKKKIASLLSIASCVVLSLSVCSSVAPKFSVEAASTLQTYSGQTLSMSNEQIKGTEDGYSYELWNQYDQGTTSMILGEGGSYSCTWSGIENVLFRRGVDFDCTKTYKELGNISVEYEAEYNNPSQNTYLCVYGWTRDPLVEYYIVDSWGSWRPPGSTSIGQITVDGGTYDVYETDRVNQPSIDGTTTFKQYWSVRTSKRTSGTISVSKHFEEWEKLGLETGKLYEAALNVEGYQSSGTANVTKNVITVGGEIQDSGSGSDSGSSSVSADENGYYYHSTFENGEDDWVNRGSASIATTSSVASAGSQSLAVTGREDSWNGTARSLSTSTFQPGQSYSFSTMVMQNTTSSEDFRLTLQYDDASGETNYATVASGTGSSGEWLQLANTSYTIPSGATNMLLYVETADSTTSFYIDEAIGAVAGTKVDSTTGSSSSDSGSSSETGDTNSNNDSIRGDFDKNGTINAMDVTLSKIALMKRFSGTTETIDMTIADIDGNGVFSAEDIKMLQQYILGQISAFPKITVQTTTTTPETTTTTTTSTSLATGSGNYMDQVANSIQIDYPSSFTQERSDVDYGTMVSRTYYSKDGQINKNLNILLPAGYNENESYPVLYVLHGIFGDENSMPGMGIQTMLGNLVADGEAEKMIVVFPAMFTGSGSPGFNAESSRKYDLIREDIENSIMPFMEENYSVKTGRENTAITGFSMGGREALYTGITRSEIYGYVGAACPAPGIFATTDAYMTHEGCLTESEFKPSTSPYLILISAAQNDSVVGTYPQTYHDALTNNGVQHLWQTIPSGDHGGATVTPHMYNFLRLVFKN